MAVRRDKAFVAGRTFTGWSTEPGGSGAPVQAGLPGNFSACEFPELAPSGSRPPLGFGVKDNSAAFCSGIKFRGKYEARTATE